jgi:hypothetical protein
LAFAARESRCLVSGNVRHFVRLGQDAIREARGHAGIVLFSLRAAPGAPGRLVAPLEHLAQDSREGLGAYAVVFL